MKQKIISALLASALLTSAFSMFTGCDLPNLGKQEETEETTISHGIDDHEWIVHEIVQEKTCLKDGVISYFCACGEYQTKVQTTTGHNYGKWETIADATCQSTGTRQRRCSECGATEDKTQDTVNHIYVNGLCKWCKAPQSESNGNNSSNSSSNGNGSNSAQDNNNISSEGLEFTSNGDGTCYLSRVTAFKNKTVTIPSTFNGETVTGIGKDAFLELDSMETALTHISIPATVTSIADYAFFECENVVAYTVNSANPAYCSENGILYNKTKTTLVCYPSGKTDAVFILPSSVTTIGVSAFNQNIRLVRLCIETNLKTVCVDAFSGSYRLCEICYSGSEQQWESISIAEKNYGLTYSATFFNVNPDQFQHFIY